MPMDNVQLAESLFAAFAANDGDAARELCNPDLKAFQNAREAMTLDTLLQFSSAVSGVVQNFRYEDNVCSATESGFVEEHTVRGTLADGSELLLRACVVGEVSNGKVDVLREYVDSAAASGLVRALAS